MIRPRGAIEDAATLDGSVHDPAVATSPTLNSSQTGARDRRVENVARISVAGVERASEPARIGRYVVLRSLGQGGMGVVYSAYDADLDRKVAVKVLRNGVQDSSLGRARVIKEAQAMARIAHPNVVHVYEVGQDTTSSASQVFIAMEFIAGVSLTEWQRQHRQAASLDEIGRLYLQAAAGLEAAHRSGLIHRDFKPDNVLVGDDGRARVVDFGLARARDGSEMTEPVSADTPRREGSERLTEFGSILGTPGYMAPEQVIGEAADARSDQFSFCVALYEAIYQQLPFAGDTFEEFSDNVLAGNLRPPPLAAAVNLEVPILIERALRRGLSRDPEARFPSMQALIIALENGLLPDSDSLRSHRRKQWAAGAVVGTMLILIAIRIGTVRSPAPTVTLAGAVVLGWIMLFLFIAGGLILRKQTARQPIYRRLAYSGLLFTLYLALGRSFGYLAKISSGHYHLLETLGMAALFASEIPNVGKQYLWPVGLLLFSAVLRIVLPDYTMLHGNLIYGLVLVLGAYLRPWSLTTSSESDSRASFRGRASN